MNKLQQAIAASAVDPITILEPGTVCRTYLFKDDFPGFDGHFPGYPILPAIVQLLTVVSLASEHAGRPLVLAAVEDAKFLMPVRPGQELSVTYRQRMMGERTMHDARLSVAGVTAATCLVQLAEEAS